MHTYVCVSGGKKGWLQFLIALFGNLFHRLIDRNCKKAVQDYQSIMQKSSRSQIVKQKEENWDA